MSAVESRNQASGPAGVPVVIDGRSVVVPTGSSLLQAVQSVGGRVPTLCHAPDLKPHTSCMLCVVHEERADRLLPACSARVEGGMVITTASERVIAARRRALELLLGEHAGDCEAPCRRICPAHMDIPQMIRHVAAGRLEEAIQTVKRDIALPAVLGRVCQAPCEKGCRRGRLDQAVAICKLKQHAADVDLFSRQPWLPACAASSGRCVAIVGSGPAGLSAAYHLLQKGHACVLLDGESKPGGMLRQAVPAECLPPAVLDREIDLIMNLGADFHPGVHVGRDLDPEALICDYDAVVLAVGHVAALDVARAFGVETSESGIVVAPHTYATDRDGLYAIGDALRDGKMAIRSLAQGKSVAWAIDQAFAGQAITGESRRFDSRLGPLEGDELAVCLEGADPTARQIETDAITALTPEQAVAESGRCLHCDCYRADNCRLRDYADEYDVRPPARASHQRRAVRCDLSHADVRYESGKCISCGLCVQRAVANGLSEGLTFAGRGFDTAVGPPIGATLADALGESAGVCVGSCPTGALSLKTGAPTEPDSAEP